MPQLPPSPGVARAVMQYSTTGKPIAANVLHFRQPGSNSLSLENLGESLEAWHANSLRPLQHINTVLNKIILTDLSTNTGQSLEFTTGMPNVGAISGDPMPNNVSVVASIHTAFRGRSFRGRIYHVGLAESQCAGNHLISTQQTALQAAYNGLVLLTFVGNPDFELGVLSYFHNGNVRGQGLFTPAVSISMNARLDSQRRRMPAA